MNPLALCLSIMPIQGPTSAPPPVIEIVQTHIAAEMKRQIPGFLVNFNVVSCPNVIHFEEGVSSLKLVGDTPVWAGEKQITYTDALAQRPLNFEENLSVSPAIAQQQNQMAESGKSGTWKKWLLWTGVSVVATGVIYYTLSRHSDRKEANRPLGLSKGVTF